MKTYYCHGLKCSLDLSNVRLFMFCKFTLSKSVTPERGRSKFLLGGALWRNCIRWYCTGFLHNAFELGLLAVFLCMFKLIKCLLTSGRALQSPLRCDLGSIGTGMFMMQPNLARWRLLTSGRALQSPLRCDLGSVSAGALTLQPNLARWRQSC